MRADSLRTEVQRTLTHEYIHLTLDEKAGSTSLPAWLNEAWRAIMNINLDFRVSVRCVKAGDVCQRRQGKVSSVIR